MSKGTKGHQIKKRFPEEQIIHLLGGIKAGGSVKELSREHGITLQTICTWKTKFDDMTTGEAQKLRSLEQENVRLADLGLDNQILKDVNHKRSERIHCKLKLQIKNRERRLPRTIQSLIPYGTGDVLAIDFVFDYVESGSKLKVLTMVDEHSKSSPGILVRIRSEEFIWRH